MRTTTLGATALEVSRVCFGTWAFGGNWGPVDRPAAVAAVRRARELGINFFDTAQAYGFGRAEEILAEGLGEDLRSRRDEIVLATKGGLRQGEGRYIRDASRDWLRDGLEQSLLHLGVDHVDIYQVHWPDPDTPVLETARALADFVDEGKVRYVGVSNFDGEQMAQFEQFRKIDTAQPPYHWFRREVERDVLPYCREHDVGVFVYGALAHGLATGKYDVDEEFPEGDWRRGTPAFGGERLRRNLDVVARLDNLAGEHGRDSTRLAVAWTLAHPAVDAAIVGAREPWHIEATAAAADWELDEETLERIDEILEGAVPTGGPTPEGHVDAAGQFQGSREP